MIDIYLNLYDVYQYQDGTNHGLRTVVIFRVTYAILRGMMGYYDVQILG